MTKPPLYPPKVLKPTRQGRTWHTLLTIMGAMAIGFLLLVIIPLIVQGAPRLTPKFLFLRPQELGGGGIAPEVINTLAMVGISQGISLPLALLIAIYRVEYDHYSPLIRWFDQGLQILLSLPTIVIGLIVVDVAIVHWHWPVSVQSGIVALTLINWPFAISVLITVLRRIPGSWREGSWALGASRWQTIWYLILPVALADMIEQVGLAVARLMGETAALIYTAGLNVGNHFALSAPGETLAVHLWYVRTEGLMPDAGQEAAATGVVLLVVVFVVLWASQKLAQWVKGL
ncbi:MAG: phosphate ABC transporter permease [Sulfobacillus thermosulfidooxidans]|uniref:Phosphate ABC transporter permease n=1 Tax=Sulfobacillus thermosulfidooxidans TaxID=28034 RepID=A0A2T2X232_SULTH|nr:MAG: phosphate ABC transporter permease [Sulfobacillus thermosulfidooxidans]